MAWTIDDFVYGSLRLEEELHWYTHHVERHFWTDRDKQIAEIDVPDDDYFARRAFEFEMNSKNSEIAIGPSDRPCLWPADPQEWWDVARQLIDASSDVIVACSRSPEPTRLIRLGDSQIVEPTYHQAAIQILVLGYFYGFSRVLTDELSNLKAVRAGVSVERAVVIHRPTELFKAKKGREADIPERRSLSQLPILRDGGKRLNWDNLERAFGLSRGTLREYQEQANAKLDPGGGGAHEGFALSKVIEMCIQIEKCPKRAKEKDRARAYRERLTKLTAAGCQ